VDSLRHENALRDRYIAYKGRKNAKEYRVLKLACRGRESAIKVVVEAVCS
jgi:hypothetical protein